NNGKLFSFRNSTLNNITFENNSGGINLYYTNVTDSSFINNQQIVTDNLRIDGGVLYVSGNTTIDNCKFINNTFKLTNSLNQGGHGGALSVSGNTTITNTLFDTNILDSTSTWANSGSGGAIGASYISQVYSLTVLNCTFKNNSADNHAAGSSSTGEYQNAAEGASIYIGSISWGDILIENNTFTDEYSRSYGSILVNQNPIGENQKATTTIRNNNFTNIKSDYETLKINGTGTKTVENNNYQNCKIQYKNLTLTAPEKIYSNDIITITANIELLNPDYYDEDLLEKTSYTWYIDGENTTNSNTSVNLNTTNENHILYITPTISSNRSPILLITPTLINDIVITPENINRYVFDGELLVSPNTKLLFNGEFNNIGEVYNTKNEVIFNGENATFTNTTFIIEAHNNTIHNMNINNTDTSGYIITLIGNDNRVNNNILTQYNSNGQTAAIYNNNGENNIISNNTINVTGPSLSITYSGGTSTANTQAILSVGGQNNQIIYNNITVSNSTDAELEQFSTIEAITAPQGINNNISYNNIYCTGARFNYGINTLDNVINNKITYNNITVTGYRYTDGIQVGNAATGNIIANNNINLTCLNTTPVDEAAISYGVIITSQGGQTSDNNTITENTININGAVNYGMEIYTATNTKITENNITLNGVKSMGIGYAHSPNSLVANNTLIITDDSSQPLNSVTEEIQPLSVGIRIQQDSENIQIENNTITTNDKAKTDKTIDTTDANTTIKNNKLTSSTGYGDETTKTISDTTLENNTIETTTTLELPETIITNTPVTLTATVTTTDGTPINGGVVTFTKGNEAIAQTTVIDGVATATHTFTQEEDATIVASYTPESTGLSTSSAEATTSIQAPVTQLNIEDVDLTAGETVTLTARVTDQNGNNLNGGKVSFKVNGKTVKDANGKVVYA
ncbi:MAG: right-handed parallel beta-helix repeat-containing protein, partial [Methanosphaera sp.]|nr:right-handed parallel beta-helix repeat-containing protein [Methanosphaera sp.]